MTLKINIESYEAYNNGYLLGKWHDISDLDRSELHDLMDEIIADHTKKLNKLLKWNQSNPEELFAADFECSFDLDSTESIEDIFDQYIELKELLESLDSDEIELAQAIREHYGSDYMTLAESVEKIQDCFELDSSGSANYELGYHIMESTGELSQLPDHISRYFDYESFGHDLVLGGDYQIIETKNSRYALPTY